MTITIEQLAVRLTAEAQLRGIPTEVFLDELAARLDDPLEAFISCAESGNKSAFDIRQERSKVASTKSAEEI